MQMKPETGCYILNIIALTQQSNNFFKIGLWGYDTSKICLFYLYLLIVTEPVTLDML